MREKIAGKLAGLRTASDALRAKHSAQDDERAAAADAAARLLAAKEETAKVRSERREGRRRRADAISSEIATCAVSDRALGELNTRLDQQREAFEDKQRDATSSTVRFFLLIFERAMRMTVFFLIYKQIADDLDAKCRELEELDRKLQRLRSEQDRAAAGECIFIFVRAIRLTSCLCTDALLAEVQNMSKVFGNFVRAAATQVSLFECICIIIVRASI